MTADWIEHDGSEWPKHAKPEDRVIVRFRDGYESRDTYSVKFFHGGGGPKGSNWYWDPSNRLVEVEIAAYRVVSK